MTGHELAIANNEWPDDRVAFIRKHYLAGADDRTVEQFLTICRRRNLAPEEKQIYLVPRGGSFTIQTGIDGFRVIADRTGLYAGSDDAVFVYDENQFVNKASVTVWKLVNGVRCAFTASALWEEYAGDGPLWKRMPHVMLAKCAESQALRKAFPADLSGLYSTEEMAQADRRGDAPTLTVHDADTPIEFTSTRGRHLTATTPDPGSTLELPATARQTKFIQAMAKERHFTEASLEAACQQRYLCAFAELTRRSASDMIAWFTEGNWAAGQTFPSPADDEVIDIETGEISEPPAPVQIMAKQAQKQAAAAATNAEATLTATAPDDQALFDYLTAAIADNDHALVTSLWNDLNRKKRFTPRLGTLYQAWLDRGKKPE